MIIIENDIKRDKKISNICMTEMPNNDPRDLTQQIKKFNFKMNKHKITCIWKTYKREQHRH